MSLFPPLSSLHEHSLCHAALHSLDWWGLQSTSLYRPLLWLSGGVKFSKAVVKYHLEMSRAQFMPPDANSQIKCLQLKRWSKRPFQPVYGRCLILFNFFISHLVMCGEPIFLSFAFMNLKSTVALVSSRVESKKAHVLTSEGRSKGILERESRCLPVGHSSRDVYGKTIK